MSWSSSSPRLGVGSYRGAPARSVQQLHPRRIKRRHHGRRAAAGV